MGAEKSVSEGGLRLDLPQRSVRRGSEAGHSRCLGRTVPAELTSVHRGPMMGAILSKSGDRRFPNEESARQTPGRV